MDGFAWVAAAALAITVALGAAEASSPKRGANPLAGRSGDLRAYADNATGCQYLGTARGGLTPRLDASGKHMGCEVGK